MVVGEEVFTQSRDDLLAADAFAGLRHQAVQHTEVLLGKWHRWRIGRGETSRAKLQGPGLFFGIKRQAALQ